MDKKKRMQELKELLSNAARAYYQEDTETMSNFAYDQLYDELVALERETGVILANSPTQMVGYEVLTGLPKETHERPMLSLDKTKERGVLKEFVGEHKVLLSWKLDGLTIVLHYAQGQLVKAVTRGNGNMGEVVTNNAKVFVNVPLKIPYQGNLSLRGEAVITYEDFEQINLQIEDVEARYKNPRNLCSGSVRQLNNEITAKRNVRFYAFGLVNAEGVDFENSHGKQMEWLEKQGFDVVPYEEVTADTVESAIDSFDAQVKGYHLPSDGLVAIYDDIRYGAALGSTSKFPRNAMAFKWEDETRETCLREIEWSPSRTGLINPVAIFEPVELEGSTVSRASVHNISIMKALELGIGDEIQVYKANMIIPQIAENLTRSGVKDIPEYCPACHQDTTLKKVNDVEVLYCTNQECPAKAIKGFTLFVSRDALNIEGLSQATLEKFIAKGFIREYCDIFTLEQYQEEITVMEGFGKKSYTNMIDSIKKASKTTLPRLIYALGIENIGLANAKMICRVFHDDLDRIRQAASEELQEIDGIGEVIAQAFVAYFQDEKRNQQLDRLLPHLAIQKTVQEAALQVFAGQNFVITGSVTKFANRDELKAFIEARGGKVTGSVTSKTQYLINNDTTSGSTKNKKAKSLNIPIISEEAFINLLEKS